MYFFFPRTFYLLLILLYILNNILIYKNFKIISPSFERTDLAFDPVSSKYISISCPDKCIECTVNGLDLICIKCEYGATIHQGVCINCPQNCFQCFDSPLDW